MPEVTITYKKPETLKVLAKYFDFKVSTAKPKKNKPYKINRVTIIPASELIDNDDVTDLKVSVPQS